MTDEELQKMAKDFLFDYRNRHWSYDESDRCLAEYFRKVRDEARREVYGEAEPLLQVFIATCECGNYIDPNDADRARDFCSRMKEEK